MPTINDLYVSEDEALKIIFDEAKSGYIAAVSIAAKPQCYYGGNAQEIIRLHNLNAHDLGQKQIQSELHIVAVVEFSKDLESYDILKHNAWSEALYEVLEKELQTFVEDDDARECALEGIQHPYYTYCESVMIDKYADLF